MIEIAWNEKNLNSFYNKMEKIIKEIPNKTKEGIESSLKGVQASALRFLGSKNQEIIQVELVNLENMQVTGRIITNTKGLDNQPWAGFREFGTGRHAELEHIGKTETFINSGYEYWLIPVEKVARPLNYPIKMYGNKRFYVAHGSEPKPFMRPAAMQGRDISTEEIQKSIYELFKEVFK